MLCCALCLGERVLKESFQHFPLFLKGKFDQKCIRTIDLILAPNFTSEENESSSVSGPAMAELGQYSPVLGGGSAAWTKSSELSGSRNGGCGRNHCSCFPWLPRCLLCSRFTPPVVLFQPSLQKFILF